MYWVLAYGAGLGQWFVLRRVRGSFSPGPAGGADREDAGRGCVPLWTSATVALSLSERGFARLILSFCQRHFARSICSVNFPKYLSLLCTSTQRQTPIQPLALYLMLCRNSKPSLPRSQLHPGEILIMFLLKNTLTLFYQYVTCPTRHNKTLDLCYGSV